jgi:type II secretory pathway pseudopilin PulG
MKLQHSTRRAAMTLIELLVIVIVVGFLSALVMPSLLRPQHSYSSRISCVNNLKQLILQ